MPGRIGVYRDDDILVINKPAFLLSVPGRAPENSDCVTRRLKRDHPDLRLVTGSTWTPPG